ncbi:Uncharacterised protein [Mycobacterium tuberculosis]|nr:Uncharacterised protein [Mycobacterium tuberculosis]
MDERGWRAGRVALDGGRALLGDIASALYPDVPRVAGTPLLCREGWVPDAPVPLAGIRLGWDDRPVPPAVADPADGLPDGYRTYAEAMGALAPPKVFEDRPSYRLLDADLPVLRFGPARYFDGVNVGEAVAHELAAAAERERAGGAGESAGGVGRLALRGRVGDPCDLGRRPALCAITTVTVTVSGWYVLHRRDPAKVAHAGGLYQVMPVGVFQPLHDEAPDLWQCMVREYAEEFLGMAEEYPDGFVQEEWPFHRAMTAAREEGRLRAYFLGLGVDPLTFALDLLTVVAVDDDLFGDLFAGLVPVNGEGAVSIAPFDGTVPRPMQPAGAAALRLAWRHRAALGLARGLTRG